MLKLFWTILATLRFFRQARTVYQIHSPLGYQLIGLIQAHDKEYYAFRAIEKLRQATLHDNTIIKRTDYGTGQRNETISIGHFAQKATISRERGEGYFRLMNWKKPGIILELGTALGFSAAYLASPVTNAQLHTMEGDPALVDYAQEVIGKLELQNITFYPGKIEDRLSILVQQLTPIDVVHLDANHSYEATMAYFQIIRPHLARQALIIVDDIRWSAGMYRAWQSLIKGFDRVMVIEFYGWGLLILDAPVPASVHLVSIPTRWKPWTVLQSI